MRELIVLWLSLWTILQRLSSFTTPLILYFQTTGRVQTVPWRSLQSKMHLRQHISVWQGLECLVCRLIFNNSKAGMYLFVLPTFLWRLTGNDDKHLHNVIIGSTLCSCSGKSVAYPTDGCYSCRSCPDGTVSNEKHPSRDANTRKDGDCSSTTV